MRIDQIIQAIDTGDLPEFKNVLGNHFKEILFSKIQAEKTALDLIVKYGRASFFELILDELNSHKAEKIPDDLLYDLLDRVMALAYFYRQPSIMRLAMDERFSVRVKDFSAALPQAVYEEDFTNLNVLIEQGVHFNAASWYFRYAECAGIPGTALTAALEKKSAPLVKLLLRKGAYLLLENSQLVCVAERANDVLALFPDSEKKEITVLLNLAKMKAEIFSAISGNDSPRLRKVLDHARAHFPAYCSTFFDAKNQFGRTPIEEAFQKKDPAFRNALVDFNKLNSQNNNWALRGENSWLTQEEQKFVETPSNFVGLALAARERQLALSQEAAQGSEGAAVDNFYLAPDSGSEDMFPSAAVELRSSSPSIFKNQVPFPSAPPLAQLLEDDQKAKAPSK